MIHKTIRYFTYFLIAFWIFIYVIRFYNGTEKGYVRILDCADYEMVYIKQLQDSGVLIPTDVKELETIIPEPMEGIPRYFYRTGLSYTYLFFSLLPPYYAYLIQDVLVHLIGIIAMFIFLKNYIIQDEKIAILVAMIFGFLNYQHIHYGITVAGMPLIFNAFLNVFYKKAKWFDYVFIFLIYPFFSFAQTTVPYIGATLGIIGLYHWLIAKQRFPLTFFLLLFLYGIESLLLEYPLLYGMFWGVPSHREEMITIPLPIIQILKFTIMGSDLFGIAHYEIVILLLGLAFFITYLQKEIISLLRKALPWVALLVGIFVFIILYQTTPLKNLDKFNLRKSIVLLPIIYFSLTALAFQAIIKHKESISLFYKVGAFILLGIFVSTVLWKNHEIRGNIYNFISSNSPYPSLKELYLPQFWEHLKQIISPSEKNKIACIGYHANIAQYHGFYTVDSYRNNYPLQYKHKFRKVIENELKKNEKIRRYFDYWGNRCAIIPAEYPDIDTYYFFKPRITRMKKMTIRNLSINTQFLKDSLKCNWIVSTMDIQNYKELNLSLQEKYETRFFNFRIYKIN